MISLNNIMQRSNRTFCFLSVSHNNVSHPYRTILVTSYRPETLERKREKNRERGKEKQK